ncbi:hypothetical protein Y032_0033g2762 [Ancylostoma ceylanicum]|uniref:Target of rapamycin complex subunit lst8 n=2 Tax=Ancylostoma ceylanicum TaxID=53326 RepID=A0A016UNZ4_9BILA|nr:hypothetical protein Y032_0033g2762 [Ancylostoma ceylanicum]
MTEVHSLMASASYDQTVRIWDVGSGRHVTTIPHSDSQVNAMAFTPNGYQLAVAAFQKVRIYDMTSLKPPNHINPIVCFEQIMKNVTAIGFEASFLHCHTYTTFKTFLLVTTGD